MRKTAIGLAVAAIIFCGAAAWHLLFRTIPRRLATVTAERSSPSRKFARGAELGRRVGAQSRGAQTNPPRDARAANECLLSGVIRTTFVGPDAFFNNRRNWPTSRRAARSL